jgi:hypothetical protein
MSFLSFAFADNLLNINDVNMLFARNTVKNVKNEKSNTVNRCGILLRIINMSSFIPIEQVMTEP